MTECNFCPFDEQNCDACKIPEFTDEKYRDTCDVCHKFIMIHCQLPPSKDGGL